MINWKFKNWVICMFNIYSTKFLTFKSCIAVCLFVSSFFLLSCSNIIQQYPIKPPPHPDRTLHNVPQPLDEPTNPDGGLLLHQKLELSEEERDIKVRENSLASIDYQTGSAGNISVETSYEEAINILSLELYLPSEGIYIYREGLTIKWEDTSPRYPLFIHVSDAYQGSMDFGPWMEEDQRYVRIGQSFANYFTLDVEDIQEDEKAIFFITSLYKHLENTDEDCLASETCRLSVNSQENLIVFDLPKMRLFFGNNSRRKLVKISIKSQKQSIKRKKDFYCSDLFFDLIRSVFVCKPSMKILAPKLLRALYQRYGSFALRVQSDEITYTNGRLLQSIVGIIFGWTRDNIEEEPDSIPGDSRLVFLKMNRNFESNFLLDDSFIKVKLKGNNDIELIEVPRRDIDAKNQDHDENDFYFSTRMPQIKGNYVLQKNLIKALLELMESKFRSHSANEEEFKSYTRILGEHNDKTVLEAKGILRVLVAENFYPLALDIAIKESSGDTDVTFYLIEDDFEEYVFRNQKPIDFINNFGCESFPCRLKPNQTVKELAGFTLGDKIYLRNQDTGDGKAIVSYFARNGQTLKALVDYRPEVQMEVAYESGRDRSISFQNSSLITATGVMFNINPTFKTRKMDGRVFFEGDHMSYESGHVFDEYEINGITVEGDAFFEKINNLCAIEGFQLEMGLYDVLFTRNLIQRVSQVRSRTRATESTVCFYFAPQDEIFSGLKDRYFFPKYQVAFGFEDRELYTVRIYKRPSKQNGEMKNDAE